MPLYFCIVLQRKSTQIDFHKTKLINSKRKKNASMAMNSKLSEKHFLHWCEDLNAVNLQAGSGESEIGSWREESEKKV